MRRRAARGAGPRGSAVGVDVALARLLVAAVVLLGLVHSGARYYYCETFGLSVSDPCVQHTSHERTGCPLSALGTPASDCCKLIRLASLPPASRDDAPAVPPPQFTVAPAPSAPLFVDPGRAAIDARLAVAKQRPPPRERVHSEVMVFLT